MLQWMRVKRSVVVKQDDDVKSPDHYTNHPSGVECKEIVMHMTWPIGNAVKYLWRCDGKGVPIKDLHKAIECINIELERREIVEKTLQAGESVIQ